MNTVQLKRDLRAANKRRKTPYVDHMSMVPVWGRAARRLCRDLLGYSDRRRAWAHFHPETPAQKVRRAVVTGYKSIMGAKEGGAIQRAIAKWCGLSHDQPWCAETWWWVHVVKAGFNGPRPSNPFYVPSVELWAKAHKIIVRFRDALPGMSVTFVWDGKRGVGLGDHIGTLVKTGILKHTIAHNPRVAAGNAEGHPDAVKVETFYWWQINIIFDPARLQK